MTTPASVAARRESRTVKRPKKDLDDEPVQQHGSNKGKKEPLTESLKYCGVILRELFSKKHAVSHVISVRTLGRSCVNAWLLSLAWLL